MTRSWGQVLLAIVMEIALVTLAAAKLAALAVAITHSPADWANRAWLPGLLLACLLTWVVFSRTLFVLESEAAKIRIPISEIAFVLVPIYLIVLANVLFVRSLFSARRPSAIVEGIAPVLSPSTAASICHTCGGALAVNDRSCPACSSPRAI